MTFLPTLLLLVKNKYFSSIAPVLFSVALFLLSPYYSSVFFDKKEISYALFHSENLMKSYKGVDEWSSLQTIFEESKLESAYLSSVFIVNTGSIPIEKNDFDSDVLISFDENTEIIGARVERTYPSNLDVSYSLNEKGILFKALLLNPEDRFSIEFLSKNEPKNIVMNARISGINEPKVLDHTTNDGVYIKIVKHKNLRSSSEYSYFQIYPAFTIFLCLASILSLNIILSLVDSKSLISLASVFIPLVLSIFVLTIVIDGVLLLNDVGHSSIYSTIASATLALLCVPLSNYILKYKRRTRPVS